MEQIIKQRVLLEKIREKCSKTSKKGVSIILATNKPKYASNIFSNYKRIKYPYMELIIVLNNNNLKIEDYKIKAENLDNVRIFQLDESCTLGECLNFAVEKSKYDYISKMDDDDYYGTNYITDLMNAFKYTDAVITGKQSCFIYFEYNNMLGILSPNFENKYVSGDIAGGTITFKKEIFKDIKFRYLNKDGTDNYFLQDCDKAGKKMFSADKFNYVYIKHKNLKEHTWKINSEELMKFYCKKLMETKNFTSFITV
ncbi:glycosyl transferase family 2 [Clostridium ragsdalei P11]|uniref:Glycosyl transferase family 2 n=1 Tax=Clostridium ragsdalei P11 TaxID=1353534 RepID=A0A1A6AI68_9CLOT|nr:glycosyltransferase family A protein [Clostridium ragsdalei]OBR89762.1 glycosyl transferase family 2 [Clostridium ragsdalei P11]